MFWGALTASSGPLSEICFLFLLGVSAGYSKHDRKGRASQPRGVSVSVPSGQPDSSVSDKPTDNVSSCLPRRSRLSGGRTVEINDDAVTPLPLLPFFPPAPPLPPSRLCELELVLVR